MASRPRPPKKPSTALGIPDWLWERLDGTAIFALLLVLVGVPALVKVGVEPILAVVACTTVFLAYIGLRCFTEVFAWKKEEATLNREALKRLTELLPLVRPRLERPPENVVRRVEGPRSVDTR